MRVGMVAVFQNPGRARSDFDVYRDEKILDIRRRVGNDHFVGVFSYAGMPAAEAERNMRLFAKEVMPPLQRLESGASR